MNFGKIFFGALIYMFWSVLIGYLIAPLLPWAIIIAALVAGIYAGLKIGFRDAVKNGFVAGLVGGITLGIISLYTPTVYGIPLSVSIVGFLSPLGISAVSLISIPTMAVVGCLFGAVGGLLGSITHLRKIFLFLVLFTLFMFYLALDNAAWYLGRMDWEWSISHVLTHWIDISVSLAFAFVVVALADVLKIYQ
jgi:hypothetical protein